MPISDKNLITILLMLSVLPALLTQTAGGQQFTTETVGVVTTTYVSLFNTTIVSVSNVTQTIVQTSTVTSQTTMKSLSSTQTTITETLTSVNVKTVEPTFLEANSGWLLPLVVFASVLTLLVVAGRLFGVER